MPKLVKTCIYACVYKCFYAYVSKYNEYRCMLEIIRTINLKLVLSGTAMDTLYCMCFYMYMTVLGWLSG